jgi:diaminopimelate decarboxylase
MGSGINDRTTEAWSIEEFVAVIVLAAQAAKRPLVIEPGCVIVGNDGILVSRVIYTKRSGDKRFLIQDAAMNDLIRPALYEAFHRILPVNSPRELQDVQWNSDLVPAGAEPWNVAALVCESSDFLAKDHPLSTLNRGSLVATFSAGAHGVVMASNNNSRSLAAEIWSTGRQCQWFTTENPTSTSSEMRSTPCADKPKRFGRPSKNSAGQSSSSRSPFC